MGANPNRIGLSGAWLGILGNLTLAAVKLTAGVYGQSRALVADGLNNLTDLLGSVAVLVGIHVASRPADAEHRYGHQRAETLAAFFVAGLMAAVGLEVAVGAAATLVRREFEVPRLLAVAVAGGSFLVKEIMFRVKARIARRIRSEALMAGAWDDRSDALVSLAALAGTLGARAGLRWLDPAAGLAVAAFILRTAWRLGREGAHLLMDGFDADALDRIRARVALCPGVQAVHRIRARRQGDAVLVDVTIGVHRSLTVAEGHAVAEQVERDLTGFMGIREVMVHVEPVSE